MAAPSILGLNIGEATICAAEMRAAGGRFEITGVAMTPTPEGAVMGGIVNDPGVVGNAIKDLLVQCGAKTKQCVSSVAGQSSLVVRVIEVPRMSQKELDEMMRFELERHIPFQANEVVLDYKRIERTNEDPTSANMEVLLAAAQEEMINSHVACLEAAGLMPRAIDIEPLAASRVFVDLVGGPGQTLAILNIGASSSEISVVRDGVLAFTRTVPMGGDSITRAIAEAFELTKPEAERMKIDHGSALPPQTQKVSGGFAPAATQSAQPAKDTIAFDLDEPETPKPATQTPASGGDPFALDFGDEADIGEAAAFDFDLDPATGGKTETKPAAASGGGVGFDLDFEPSKPKSPQPDQETQIPSVETGRGHRGGSDIVPKDEHAESLMELYNTLAPVLDDLLGEVRRSLEYFTGRFPDVPISRLILVGGGARLRNLDELVQSELGIRTSRGNPFQHVTVSDPKVSQEYLAQQAPTFAVAVGLALRDLLSK